LIQKFAMNFFSKGEAGEQFDKKHFASQFILRHNKLDRLSLTAKASICEQGRCI
jgi:hypothetical protein